MKTFIGRSSPDDDVCKLIPRSAQPVDQGLGGDSNHSTDFMNMLFVPSGATYSSNKKSGYYKCVFLVLKTKTIPSPYIPSKIGPKTKPSPYTYQDYTIATHIPSKIG